MKYRLKVASGPLTGQAFELGERTRIGSAADAEIRIEGLASEHARVLTEGDGLVLEALDESRVNGEAVTRVGLQSGDELHFGVTRLVLQAPGLKPARVLDRVPERKTGGWRWAVIGVLLAGAAAAAGWWWLAQRAVE